VLVTAAAVAALAACGKEGPPLPPLPRGPLPPRGVVARQIGTEVVVAFDRPLARGPRPSQRPERAELLRVVYPPGLQPTPDPETFRRRGEIVDDAAIEPTAGAARLNLHDRLLLDVADGGVGSTLRYAVRLRDRKGRPSALALADDLVPLETRRPPAELTGEPTADGVRLVWRAAAENGAAPAEYNVYRTQPGQPWPEQPLNARPIGATEFLDGAVETGGRYLYAVRIALAPEPPARESAASEPLGIVAEDHFPPAAPTDLVAVQEDANVRLFWNPAPERDVAGYLVFRSADGAAWERLGAGPVEQPQFLDDALPAASARLAYRVAAIDRVSPPNQSPMSETVELELAAGEPAVPPERP